MAENGQENVEEQRGITKLTVSGFKSLRDKTEVEIRPLTILAGANSSGKSSIIQPLLMMKQTLEARYDPGALLLNGPNVKFTRADQFFRQDQDLRVGMKIDEKYRVENLFRSNEATRTIDLIQSDYGDYVLTPSMSNDEIVELFTAIRLRDFSRVKDEVIQERCFYDIGSGSFYTYGFSLPFRDLIHNAIHIAGLRGMPERTYPIAALITVGRAHFGGTFEHYTASVIRHWQQEDVAMLHRLGESLATLQLTRKVEAKRVDDTQVELLVGQPRKGMSDDDKLVSVADVGLGVSQILPVLVALLVAQPGQLVYIEQPEIHLHPKAQVALARVLADAAKRGVRVVAETHSALLLLGIQTLVAEGELDKGLVKLHWFSLQDDGTSKVTSHDLDETGAYGDWPEDFGDVELNAQSDYLDAVTSLKWG